HRGVGGTPLSSPGLDAQRMIDAPRKAYILFGIEPEQDLANGERAARALQSAQTVVCFTPFVSEQLLACATVLLPIGTFAETAGTFVNAEGRWQSFDAAADLSGDARPGWRVLRVLGNELSLPECEYQNPSDVCAALEQELGGRLEFAHDHNFYESKFNPSAESASVADRDLDVPIYAVDAVVRRSEALQQTSIARGSSAP
ncbi:MAG TPA: molybdopterin-dependent oxidoreductase, partial [Gammaproteobacteria bacterium]|nr:molybdopterin-dependent oxidoreductase [Gammaproteobacteria bacterium]